MNIRENSEVDQYTKHLKNISDKDLCDLVGLADNNKRKQLQTYLIYKEAAHRFKYTTINKYYEGEERW